MTPSLCGAGFLFAFKVYDPQEHHSLHALETAVKMLTADDIIHVAICTVAEPQHLDAAPAAGEMLSVCSNAITAVVGCGFCEHSAQICLDSHYLLLYLPLSHDKTQAGVRFLQAQRGKPYNYAALPLTLLPQWLKGSGACGAKSSAALDLDPSHIFCSQMGLLLCHVCGAFDSQYGRKLHNSNVAVDEHEPEWELLNPARCTPSELYHAVRHALQAHEWHPERVHVLEEEACTDVLACSTG